MLNVVLPGSGLIVRRREWLGVSLAAVFGICGNVTLAGMLIAPNAIPRWLTLFAGVLSAATWIFSQVLFRRQGVLLERRASGLHALLAGARLALGQGNVADARTALESARALDDENAELQSLWSELAAREDDKHTAR